MKTLPPTEGMHYRAGFKAELEKPWYLELPHWFRIPSSFSGEFSEEGVRLKGRSLSIEPGFMWNFANGVPDWEWIKVPSGAHDGLLWFRHALIRDNVITEDDPEDKALKEDIDTVFMLLCKERLPKWSRLTPRLLFVGVNRLSRLLPGDQARDHRRRYAR